jgi:hypothetical protein
LKHSAPLGLVFHFPCRPEWGWGILGLIASGAAGAVQPAFAFIISSFITIFYTTDSVGDMVVLGSRQ